MRIGIVVLLLACGGLGAGCASVLGIDHDYSALPDEDALADSGGVGRSEDGALASLDVATAVGEGGTSGGGSADGDAPLSPLLAVQSATVTLGAGAASQSSTLTAVDPNRSFLVFGSRFDSTLPGVTELSGQMTNGTEVTFARASGTNAPAIPIHYYVAEFRSGVRVQRGSATMSNNVVPVVLAQAADPSRSFPIVTFRNTGSLYGKGDFIRASLTSPTTLTLTSGDVGGVVEWQVVTFDGASVQSGDLSLNASDNAWTAALPNAVDVQRTWLVFNYDLTQISGTTAEGLVRGHLSSPTAIAFSRDGTGAAGTLSWFAVSFTNGTEVRSSTATLPADQTSASIALPGMDPAHTLAAAAGAYLRSGATPYATHSNPGFGTFTLDVGDGSSLAVVRGASANTAAEVDWCAVRFR